jgi:SAM-dependent methyltransferase
LTELRIEFDSAEAWQRWNSENSRSYETWRQGVLKAIQSQGLTEPITDTSVPAAQIEIRPGRLLESLSSGSLNSRKRALLLEVAEQLRRDTSETEDPPNILVTEPNARTTQILRDWCSVYGADGATGTEKLKFDDGIFDFAVVGEAWQRYGDPAAALREFSRVLGPRGVLIGTVPFIPNLKAARAPSDDHSTRRVFGWELLDLAREAGFHHAAIVLRASARHGIVADGVPGALILFAAKLKPKEAEKRPAVVPAAVPAAVPGNVVCILGLPRSGTTMLAASLAVAPNVVPVLEPFNADPHQRWKNGPMTLERFIRDYHVKIVDGCNLLVKETCKTMEFVQCADQLLDSVEAPITRHCIVILRNPFHCLLSEIQGRKEWWGEPDLQLTNSLFDSWAERSLNGFHRMMVTMQRAAGFCVTYTALTHNPLLIRNITEAAGMKFVPEQLSFHEHFDPKMIRGDLSLVKNPRPIGEDSENKRDAEWGHIGPLVEKAQMFAAIEQLTLLIHELPDSLLAWDSDKARNLLRLSKQLRPS